VRCAQARLTSGETPGGSNRSSTMRTLNCAAALGRGGCERRNYSGESEAVEIASSEPVVSGAPCAKVAATLLWPAFRSDGDVKKARRHVARPPSRKRQSMPPERATRPTRLSVATNTGSLCRPHPESRPTTPFHLRVGRLGGDASEMPRAYLHRSALVRVAALPPSAPRLSDRTIRLRPEDRCRCRRPRAEAKRRSYLRPGALDKLPGSPSPCARR
jgi:hypothetical protein